MQDHRAVGKFDKGLRERESLATVRLYVQVSKLTPCLLAEDLERMGRTKGRSRVP